MHTAAGARSQRRIDLLLHLLRPAAELGDGINFYRAESLVAQHYPRFAGDVGLKDVVERWSGIGRADGYGNARLLFTLMEPEGGGDSSLADSAFSHGEDQGNVCNRPLCRCERRKLSSCYSLSFSSRL